MCTGNICRSPFAAGLMRKALSGVATGTGRQQWVEWVAVESAGTDALVGEPMSAQMGAVADRYGIDPDEHVAAQLDIEAVEGADLILAMTRAHRRDIVALVPRASGRTFTLREFARLVEDAAAVGALPDGAGWPADAFDALVAAAGARRGFAVAPATLADDDIADPHGRDDEAHRIAAEEIAAAIERIYLALGVAVGAVETGGVA